MDKLYEKDYVILKKKISKYYLYDFKNDDLLLQSLVFESYINEHKDANLVNNQILEFIGDKYLDLDVVNWLSNEFQIKNKKFYKNEYTEHFLSKFKEKIVEGNMEAVVLEYNELQQFMIIGNGDDNNNQKNKECLLEALIGAVAVDSKFDFGKVSKFIRKLYNGDFNYSQIIKSYLETYEYKFTYLFYVKYHKLPKVDANKITLKDQIIEEDNLELAYKKAYEIIKNDGE